MPNYVLAAETGHINFSPTGFRLMARDFLDCYRQFKPQQFSVVPFFLLCRAIELTLKAEHLEMQSQADVKKNYWHNLESLYNNLPEKARSLSSSEQALLKQANAIYGDKRFEYMDPFDAGTAFSGFPDLGALQALAVKLVPSQHGP